MRAQHCGASKLFVEAASCLFPGGHTLAGTVKGTRLLFVSLCRAISGAPSQQPQTLRARREMLLPMSLLWAFTAATLLPPWVTWITVGDRPSAH